jgi:chemotaxis protein CheX
VHAAQTVIESMLQPPASSGTPFFNEEPLLKYEIKVLVGVLGDLQGQVICGMSNQTAAMIASQMLGMEPQAKLDALGESAICELKNIIVGTASTNLSLHGYRCTITPPLLITGREIPEFLKHIHTALAIPIDTPCGRVEINLALRRDERDEIDLIANQDQT